MSPVPRSQAIGQQIAMLRKLRGITQQELADAIGKAKRTQVATEAGDRSPREDELRDIAEALVIPEDWLISPARYLPPTVELGPPPEPAEQTAQKVDELAARREAKGWGQVERLPVGPAGEAAA